MEASYTWRLGVIGSTHGEKAVVLAIEIGDRDGPEGQRVQTADNVHQSEVRKEKNEVMNGLNLLEHPELTAHKKKK